MSGRENGPEQTINRPSDREFTLQFFGAEEEGRTEEPTEKKKQEAMDDGNVPTTEELPSALVMGAGFLMIWITGTWMIYELKEFTIKLMSMQYLTTINQGNALTLIMDMIYLIGRIVAPIAAVSYVAAIFGFLVQTGPMFTLEPLKFDLSAIQPSINKIMEEMIFSQEVLWDFVKSLLKVVMVLGLATEVIYTEFDGLLTLIHMSLLDAVGVIMQLAFEIILKAVLLMLLIVSPIDYAIEYYQWYDDLKMTPQEVDDEKKQQEGDPEVQERQQEKMQEMSERRMMEEVPEADVIITNPTHYAVALKFDESSMEAPVVTAKGKDLTAQRIKSLASEHGIPVFEIPLLARTLYGLDLNDEIPRDLYESVATVLKWVHNQRDEAPDSGRASIEQDLKELNVAPAS
ncbi:MAG: flagellar biosynthesis protein FlhB [bacterium]